MCGGGEVSSLISKEELSFNGPLETHLQGQDWDQQIRNEQSYLPTSSLGSN